MISIVLINYKYLKIYKCNWGDFMYKYITKNRILDFTVFLKIRHKSINTITSYTTNIQKLELFLDGKELSKEQMILPCVGLVNSAASFRSVDLPEPFFPVTRAVCFGYKQKCTFL